MDQRIINIVLFVSIVVNVVAMINVIVVYRKIVADHHNPFDVNTPIPIMQNPGVEIDLPCEVETEEISIEDGGLWVNDDSQMEECQWIFKQYHPSVYELEWMRNITINQEDVCGRSTTTYKAFHDAYMDSIENISHLTSETKISNCPELLIPIDLSHGPVFSRFEYEANCNEGQVMYSYIEPLAGVMRHPEVCVNFNKALVDKNYMVLDAWFMHKDDVSLESKNFYFDLGASKWTSGAGGASQEWMVKVYSNLCVEFDHIYAWEAVKYDPVDVMNEIPGNIKPRYHWFNIPVSDEKDHPDNPLTILLSEVQPEVSSVCVCMWMYPSADY
jgi:hypothetical protein